MKALHPSALSFSLSLSLRFAQTESCGSTGIPSPLEHFYEVQLIGVDETGHTVSNGKITVTADANGKLHWPEAIGWAATHDYATQVDDQPVGGNGHWSHMNSTALNVHP